eukprot:Hpha_TRINITY_DN11763_c0_g1::TRINITY_DN11763_c0_g1_i1::g.32063::m.32063
MEMECRSPPRPRRRDDEQTPLRTMPPFFYRTIPKQIRDAEQLGRTFVSPLAPSPFHESLRLSPAQSGSGPRRSPRRMRVDHTTPVSVPSIRPTSPPARQFGKFSSSPEFLEAVEITPGGLSARDRRLVSPQRRRAGRPPARAPPPSPARPVFLSADPPNAPLPPELAARLSPAFDVHGAHADPFSQPRAQSARSQPPQTPLNLVPDSPLPAWAADGVDEDTWRAVLRDAVLAEQQRELHGAIAVLQQYEKAIQTSSETADKRRRKLSTASAEAIGQRADRDLRSYYWRVLLLWRERRMSQRNATRALSAREAAGLRRATWFRLLAWHYRRAERRAAAGMEDGNKVESLRRAAWYRLLAWGFHRRIHRADRQAVAGAEDRGKAESLRRACWYRLLAWRYHRADRRAAVGAADRSAEALADARVLRERQRHYVLLRRFAQRRKRLRLAYGVVVRRSALMTLTRRNNELMATTVRGVTRRAAQQAVVAAAVLGCAAHRSVAAAAWARWSGAVVRRRKAVLAGSRSDAQAWARSEAEQRSRSIRQRVFFALRLRHLMCAQERTWRLACLWQVAACHSAEGHAQERTVRRYWDRLVGFRRLRLERKRHAWLLARRTLTAVFRRCYRRLQLYVAEQRRERLVRRSAALQEQKLRTVLHGAAGALERRAHHVLTSCYFTALKRRAAERGRQDTTARQLQGTAARQLLATHYAALRAYARGLAERRKAGQVQCVGLRTVQDAASTDLRRRYFHRLGLWQLQRRTVSAWSAQRCAAEE